LNDGPAPLPILSTMDRYNIGPAKIDIIDNINKVFLSNATTSQNLNQKHSTPIVTDNGYNWNG